MFVDAADVFVHESNCCKSVLILVSYCASSSIEFFKQFVIFNLTFYHLYMIMIKNYSVN